MGMIAAQRKASHICCKEGRGKKPEHSKAHHQASHKQQAPFAIDGLLIIEQQRGRNDQQQGKRQLFFIVTKQTKKG